MTAALSTSIRTCTISSGLTSGGPRPSFAVGKRLFATDIKKPD